MPETRKPARYKAVHRKPAWLHISSPVKHLIRILNLIITTTLILTRRGVALTKQGLTLAARNLTRLRDSAITQRGIALTKQGLTLTARNLTRLRDSAITQRGIALTKQGLARARDIAMTAYRYLVPRVTDSVARLRGSRLGTATISATQRAAGSARDHLATVRDSAVAQSTVHRVQQSVAAAKDSQVGRLTRQGLVTVKSTAKRHTPDWALTRIRDSKSAWNTAVADSGPAFLWRAVAGVAVIAIAAVLLMGSPMSSGPEAPSAAGVPAERAATDEANRSQDRAADPEAPQPGDAVPAEPAPETEPEPEPEEAPEPTEEPPADPEPVGGLNADQMDNAVEIVRIGEEMGISERGQAVALVTAMQESQLLVLANSGIPESLDIPNQGKGQDHDSVGLFQQRPSSGWGTVEECMDVEYSTTVFYKSLKRVSGWEKMDLTVAAQSVQVSAFPDHYAKWEDLAWDIIDEVNK